jgi:hypothetical protein
MHRFALIGLALAFVGTIAGVTMTTNEALAGKACQRATFETKLVGDACTKGGQAEAKKVMKKFLKKAKKKEAALECKSCHSKLAPTYELKTDGLEHFKNLGGK